MLDADGYQIVSDVISADAATALIPVADALTRGGESDAIRSRGRDTYAVRNLLQLSPEIATLAESKPIRGLIDPILGAVAKPVRAILFDKTPGANWKVAWHQDLSIAVKEKREVAGYGPWSTKAGVCHVQPPRAVLEGMLTVRVHLDDCDESNGPLQVLPGSHRRGLLSPADVQAWRERGKPVACCVGASGVVLMRPLTLHASSPATSPRHRRVVHIEYAAAALEGGLEWYVG